MPWNNEEKFMIPKTGLSSLISSSFTNESKKTDTINKTSISNTQESKLSKVESLKQQIENGEYKINLDLLANSIADTL